MDDKTRELVDRLLDDTYDAIETTDIQTADTYATTKAAIVTVLRIVADTPKGTDYATLADLIEKGSDE